MVSIECKLCREIINFDPENSTTYISKYESGNAMIGKLYTFRVSHSVSDKNSQHINVVVLDQNKEYRAHKDYYEESKKEGTSSDFWENFRNKIPIELRSYISLADRNDKKLISSSLENLEKSIEEWHLGLNQLKNEYPDNKIIDLLSVKWAFIIGKHKKLQNKNLNPNSWSYPILLRIRARFSPSPDLIEKINNVDDEFLPRLVQIEREIAKSEIYLRLGKTELLESLYEDVLEKWGNQTTVETKSALMLIQSYYSFGLTTLGNIKKALKLIEPAFNLGQILDNKEIISVAGNFYAAILQAAGELDKALKIYNIVLETSKEIGDERMQAVISINISITESKQGYYDKALKRQRSILNSPIVQEEYFLKSSLVSIIGETLFIAERYEESIKMCKQILSEENVSTYYKSQALSILKKIAGKTSSKDLLDFVRDNLLEDKDFLESPMGRIFKYDLKAIDAELKGDWLKMVENLKEERKTMISSKSLEDVSDIEIRLARGYFRLYQQSQNLKHLNQSYNHLDLAKTIALENQSYLDLSRLITLKGLLALENDASEQAKKQFMDALNIAKEHKLRNIEKSIIKHLDQLEKGIIENSESILKKMFRILTFRKPEEKSEPKKESEVFAIFIGKKDDTWESYFKEGNQGKVAHVKYLEGFCDLWKNVRDKLDLSQFKYISGNNGSLLIENTEKFQLIAYCSNLDYMTRLSLQEILPALETYPYNNIPDELTKKSLEIINYNLPQFNTVE
jgi:hypothetical protein